MSALYEVLIDNLDGTLWNVTESISQMTWKTSRIGKPSSLEATLVYANGMDRGGFKAENGNPIQVKLDGKGFFLGRIFSVDDSEEASIQLLAYDQLRYLSESDTYIRKNIRADEVILDQCKAIGLTVGKLANTVHRIPKVSEDGQKRIDIVSRALDSTLMANGDLYVLYDDFGKVTLTHVRDMAADIVLGDESLVYGYKRKKSIEDDTYNFIKLARDNKDGVRQEFVEPDKGSMNRWGKLQYYQKVDEKLNEQQIREMAKRLLAVKNREQQKFSLEALGYPGLRAGMKVQVTVDKLGLNRFFLIEECTHKLDGNKHTMSLEMKVVADGPE